MNIKLTDVLLEDIDKEIYRRFIEGRQVLLQQFNQYAYSYYHDRACNSEDVINWVDINIPSSRYMPVIEVRAALQKIYDPQTLEDFKNWLFEDVKP
jgi:hypothetical protein